MTAFSSSISEASSAFEGATAFDDLVRKIFDDLVDFLKALEPPGAAYALARSTIIPSSPRAGSLDADAKDWTLRPPRTRRVCAVAMLDIIQARRGSFIFGGGSTYGWCSRRVTMSPLNYVTTLLTTCSTDLSRSANNTFNFMAYNIRFVATHLSVRCGVTHLSSHIVSLCTVDICSRQTADSLFDLAGLAESRRGGLQSGSRLRIKRESRENKTR